MMASQVVVAENTPAAPVPWGSNISTSRPAGPTAKTVPTMTSSTTENTRMTFFMVRPRYVPVTSEIDWPLLRSESMPDM